MPGNFVSVACGECGTEVTVFEKASTVVRCPDCDAVVAEPTGGLARLAGEVVGVVGAR